MLGFVQRLLESRSIPFVSTLAIAAMIACKQYKVMTKPNRVDPFVRDFLLTILIQVLPIAPLKGRIMSSVNRLSLLSRTASKVLLMHISVLILRVTLVPLGFLSKKSDANDLYDSPMDFWANVAALVSAVFLMNIVCEFRWTVEEFRTHSDISALHILGMVYCAFICVVLNRGETAKLGVVFWLQNYINSMEMLAFMPAVWMLFQTDEKLLAFEPLSQVDTQRQAFWVLVWMMAFNMYEDCIATTMSGLREPCAVAGHIVHFVTIIDFIFFFLQEAYESKVAKNECHMTPKS